MSATETCGNARHHNSCAAIGFQSVDRQGACAKRMTHSIRKGRDTEATVSRGRQNPGAFEARVGCRGSVCVQHLRDCTEFDSSASDDRDMISSVSFQRSFVWRSFDARIAWKVCGQSLPALSAGSRVSHSVCATHYSLGLRKAWALKANSRATAVATTLCGLYVLSPPTTKIFRSGALHRFSISGAST